MDGTVFIQQLINGLSLGAIYALIALGYTMVFGVLRFINFAHGDILMVGGYTGIILVATQTANLSPEMGSLLGVMPFFRTWFLPFLAALIAIDTLLWLSRGRKGAPFLLRPTPLLVLVTAALVLYLPLLGRSLFGGAESVLGEKSVLGSQGHLGWAIFVVLASMLVCAGFGMSVERICYRPLRSQPRITVLITAIGVSLLLESFAQFVVGAQGQSLPPVVAEEALNFETPWNLGWTQIVFPPSFRDYIVTNVQVIQFVTTIVLLAILTFIVKWTKIGTAMRALSLNPTACSLMGVNIDFVIAFTFGIGSALAGAAGVLINMQVGQSVDALMGIKYGLKAFVAAVLGGIGNLQGAVLGGFLIAIIETFTIANDFGTYKDAVCFGVLILILLVRPAGLLGKNIREKV